MVAQRCSPRRAKCALRVSTPEAVPVFSEDCRDSPFTEAKDLSPAERSLLELRQRATLAATAPPGRPVIRLVGADRGRLEQGGRRARTR